MNTSKLSWKNYKCSRCGVVKKIQTNHYGDCYSHFDFNKCQNPSCVCSRPLTNKTREVTIWNCIDQPVEDFKDTHTHMYMYVGNTPDKKRSGFSGTLEECETMKSYHQWAGYDIVAIKDIQQYTKTTRA